jgi:L-fucose isomerase-like protein
LSSQSASPVFIVASGDLRLSANQLCWSAQEAFEQLLVKAVKAQGRQVIRAHEYDRVKQHGFIDSQRMGMEVFAQIPKDSPVIVVEAVWQYTHHVLAGLVHHQGPILTVANWSGQWPGLVGMLNLNGSLTKAGVRYSTLWSADCQDHFFLDGLKSWLNDAVVHHDTSHVKRFDANSIPWESSAAGVEVAEEILRHHVILGVFDEGCMGMYNAIVPDELLHPFGMFKERLSQSALYYEVTQTSDAEAEEVYEWLLAQGMKFDLGDDETTELTCQQVLLQCKMYIAALRIADDFGCDAIGIQYQQGLKDLLPASDLPEGLLNNVLRPPVKDRAGIRVLYADSALPHFNEVDECSGVDALITNRVWNRMGFSPETTLHDIRFGEEYDGNFVWILEISGAAPPEHFVDGYNDAVSQRQPAMYFRKGGGSLKGNSKPGDVVWSRVFVEDGRLKADLGLAKVIALPDEELARRWQITTPQWPMMNAVLTGVTRDQMMARHKANHIQVAYAPSQEQALAALSAKAACFHRLGIEVCLCGVSQ